MDGLIHRSNDLPAILGTSAIKYYKHDRLHRDHNRPAVIFSNGCIFHFVNGLLHTNSNYVPAAIFSNDLVMFYKNHRVHRDDDMPAVVFKTLFCTWLKNGVMHRDFNRPAYIEHDGNVEAFLNICNETTSKDCRYFNPANVDITNFSPPEVYHDKSSMQTPDQFNVYSTKRTMEIVLGQVPNPTIFSNNKKSCLLFSSDDNSSPVPDSSTTKSVERPQIVNAQNFFDVSVYMYYKQLKSQHDRSCEEDDTNTSTSRRQYQSQYIAPTTISAKIAFVKSEYNKIISQIGHHKNVGDYVQHILSTEKHRQNAYNHTNNTNSSTNTTTTTTSSSTSASSLSSLSSSTLRSTDNDIFNMLN